MITFKSLSKNPGAIHLPTRPGSGSCETVPLRNSVHLTGAEDVRNVLCTGEQVVIDERTIVTPVARDLAAAHGVFVQYDLPR